MTIDRIVYIIGAGICELFLMVHWPDQVPDYCVATMMVLLIFGACSFEADAPEKPTKPDLHALRLGSLDSYARSMRP